MPRYSATMSDVVTSGFLTAGHVSRGASRRAYITEFTVGADAAPADTSLTWRLRRHTTAHTSTAVVVARLDLADPIAITIAGENTTAEPTYTAASELLEFPQNQRATYRWVAPPDGELVIPDTALAGIGWEVLSAAYTGNAMLSVHFFE